MKTTSIKTLKTDFLGQFQKSEPSFAQQLMPMKLEAIGNLEHLGIPTMKHEEWKYTNLAGITNGVFNIPADENRLKRSDIQSMLPEEANAVVLVFENGRFNKELSTINNIPDGVIIGRIGDFLSHPAVITHLGKIASHQLESFVALNTALFMQGVFIHAGDKKNFEKTIHLLFVNDARQAPTVSYPRTLIVAGQSAGLKISERHLSMATSNSAFCNPVTEIFVDDNARVEYCKREAAGPEDFHIDYTGVQLRKDSNFHVHTITTSGRMVRNNLRIELQERNGTAYLNGLFVIDGNTHADNHSLVDHASPDCYSNELYKGVIDGSAHGVFNGRILVRKDAQKTNAYQSNKNILLSDNAVMNAKPQLEIYADDVKCSHGATTGNLDPEALFYLRSRGIGENEARGMLTAAFAEDILERITMEEVKEGIIQSIHQRLTKGTD